MRMPASPRTGQQCRGRATGKAILIGREPEDYADRIVRLLEHPEERSTWPPKKDFVRWFSWERRRMPSMP